MPSTFEQLRDIERRELDRFESYLQGLDSDGWLDQSYDPDWRVYQVVSHVASQSVIYLGFLTTWFEDGPPMAQEQMQAVWNKFDTLAPSAMLPEFRQAKADYLERIGTLPADAGQKEVDSFLGKAKTETMLALRLHEVALHSWDVYIARDRRATLPADAVTHLLPVQLLMRGRRKPAVLDGKRVHLRATDQQWQHLIDFRGEKPAVQEGSGDGADLTLEGPVEELCRVLAGRHHVPGSSPALNRYGASVQELAAMSVFVG